MTKIVKKLVVSNPRRSFIINAPNKVLFCGIAKIKSPLANGAGSLYLHRKFQSEEVCAGCHRTIGVNRVAEGASIYVVLKFVEDILHTAVNL